MKCIGKKMRTVCAVILILPLLSACSSARSLAASFRSTKHFVPLVADDRILFEPGAEAFIQEIPALLPDAIKKVETGHFAPFIDSVKVYVCATNESYYRHTGQRAPATVTNKLFLSPALFHDNKPLDRYLTHELSHLHLRQRLGLIGSTRLPSWFKEGLAELGLEQAGKMGGCEKNHSKCLEISVLWVLKTSVEHLSRRHFE